ncbi:claspin-like, partial [Clytia hemisphaerica]|uniref:claspin-like n=1 Tax=Clytia hemisphaerica TaxID=252671 RepID=UPI0034D4F27B
MRLENQKNEEERGKSEKKEKNETGKSKNKGEREKSEKKEKVKPAEPQKAKPLTKSSKTKQSRKKNINSTKKQSKPQTEKSTGKSKSKANKSERAKDSVKDNSGPETSKRLTFSNKCQDREMSQKETDVIKAFHERQASKMNNFNGFLVEKVDPSKNKKIKTKERKNFLEKSPKTNKPRFVPQTVLSSTRNSPSSFNQELTEVTATTPIPSTEQSKLPLTSHSPSPVNQLSDTSLSKSSSPALSSTKHSFSTLSSISELSNTSLNKSSSPTLSFTKHSFSTLSPISELSNTSSPKLSPRSNLLPSFSGQEDPLLSTASASHESGECSKLAENAPKRSLSFSLQSEGKTPLPNNQTSKKIPVETIIARNATPDYIRIGSSPSRHDPPSAATSIEELRDEVKALRVFVTEEFKDIKDRLDTLISAQTNNNQTDEFLNYINTDSINPSYLSQLQSTISPQYSRPFNARSDEHPQHHHQQLSQQASSHHLQQQPAINNSQLQQQSQQAQLQQQSRQSFNHQANQHHGNTPSTANQSSQEIEDIFTLSTTSENKDPRVKLAAEYGFELIKGKFSIKEKLTCRTCNIICRQKLQQFDQRTMTMINDAIYLKFDVPANLKPFVEQSMTAKLKRHRQTLRTQLIKEDACFQSNFSKDGFPGDSVLAEIRDKIQDRHFKDLDRKLQIMTIKDVDEVWPTIEQALAEVED